MSPAPVNKTQPIADVRLDTLASRIAKDENLDSDSRDSLTDTIEEAYHTSDERKRKEMVATIRWRYSEKARMCTAVGEHFRECPIRNKVVTDQQGDPVMPWPTEARISTIVKEQLHGFSGPAITIGKRKFTGLAAVIVAVGISISLIIGAATTILSLQHSATRKTVERVISLTQQPPVNP